MEILNAVCAVILTLSVAIIAATSVVRIAIKQKKPQNTEQKSSYNFDAIEEFIDDD